MGNSIVFLIQYSKIPAFRNINANIYNDRMCVVHLCIFTIISSG